MRFFLVCAALLAAGGARAASVDVTVQGVRNDHGHVLVTLCTKADFLHPHCTWRGEAPARAGDVHVVITGVPAGTYAAQAFHDENDNRELDRNFLGMPKEGMGFSNDAPMHFGPPRFDVAAFAVGIGDVKIAFRLKYF
jgi:uncharacterized protein (DUF2141 family)